MKFLFYFVGIGLLLALGGLLFVAAAGGVGLVISRFLPLPFSLATILALVAILFIVAVAGTALMFATLMTTAASYSSSSSSSSDEDDDEGSVAETLAATTPYMAWSASHKRPARRSGRRGKKTDPDEGP